MAPAIVWFRRNLRLDDNLPFDAALRVHDGGVPVFVLDDHYLTEDFSPPRLRFLAQSLSELESDLAAKGSRLLFRRGPTGEALASLARETGAEAVYTHFDHEPHGAELSHEAEAALSAHGTRLRLLPDLHLVMCGTSPVWTPRPASRRTCASGRSASAAFSPRCGPGGRRPTRPANYPAPIVEHAAARAKALAAFATVRAAR